MHPDQFDTEDGDMQRDTYADLLEELPSATPSHDQRPAGMHAGCDCGSEPEPADPWRKGFTRRRVVGGTAAMVAALGTQTVTSKWAFSATKALNTDTIVVVNLRGGWDSLNIVVPTFEPRYYEQRPNIRVPEGAALPLNRGFGLHPALPNMHRMFRAGTFAPVVGVGTPDTTLSHFEAMDTLERGTGSGTQRDGWMNRVLQARNQNGVFSAVQFGSQLPLSLSGDAPALALDGVQSFGLAGYDDVRGAAASAFARLYNGVKHPMADQVRDTLRAIGTVQTLSKRAYTPAPTARYPENSGFSNTLKDAARLIKAKIGLTMATIDIGGWDMHSNEGRVDGGDLFNHMKELDGALAAFASDLGPEWRNVTVILVSEFGRTLRENGTVGTDHGHGQAMWVLGGGVNGGKVYGAWPGLADKDLFNNGSVGARTDYRDVLGEVLRKRGSVGSLAKVFPDHKPRVLGLVKPRA
jgi:uncharacterized protein (DUF1501 family)